MRRPRNRENDKNYAVESVPFNFCSESYYQTTDDRHESHKQFIEMKRRSVSLVVGSKTTHFIVHSVLCTKYETATMDWYTGKKLFFLSSNHLPLVRNGHEWFNFGEPYELPLIGGKTEQTMSSVRIFGRLSSQPTIQVSSTWNAPKIISTFLRQLPVRTMKYIVDTNATINVVDESVWTRLHSILIESRKLQFDAD